MNHLYLPSLSFLFGLFWEELCRTQGWMQKIIRLNLANYSKKLKRYQLFIVSYQCYLFARYFFYLLSCIRMFLLCLLYIEKILCIYFRKFRKQDKHLLGNAYTHFGGYNCQVFHLHLYQLGSWQITQNTQPDGNFKKTY